MTELKLTPITVSDLEVYTNPHAVLYDLHVFVQYIKEYEVKRMVRSNDLPKSHINRIVKRMSDPDDLIRTVKEYGGSGWLNFIDRLALQLKLVYYDTKGKYVGYSSQSPSFIDNYVIFSKKDYLAFLALPPIEQEKRIFNTLVAANELRTTEEISDIEFFSTGPMGSLDGFSSWRAGSGIIPTLDFPAIRNFLFDLFKDLQPGEWYSVSELIAYLKANHLYFLLPKKPYKDRWRGYLDRYVNFHDGANIWSDQHIPDDAPDGFERVEGRYIERFLENIPLTLRFVDLAYDPKPYTKKMIPMIGYIKAFRLSNRFFRLIQGEANPLKVTVQPNFEIIVASEFYPAMVLNQLEKVAEPVAASTGNSPVSVSTLVLKKERVAAALIQEPDLDVIEMLETLTGTSLPGNISTEIREWNGHAEMFTLYENFSLLESTEAIPQKFPYSTVDITPSICLVEKPQNAIRVLENAGLAPIEILHSEDGFTLLFPGVESIFPTEMTVAAREDLPPETVSLRRSISVSFQFPHQEIFDVFRLALVEARVPVQVETDTLTLAFSDAYLPAWEQIVTRFNSVYDIRIQ